MKSLVLCADDFSLNPAINAAIVDLVNKKRLSAVSCMTQSPTWMEDALLLSPFKGQADIGLHFNLTQYFPDAFTVALPLLMLQSHLHLVSKQKIHDSFCKQLDAFESGMQCVPDFIDGHQHVHLFPVIRDIVIDEYLKRYGNAAKKPYMRSLAQLPADTHNFKAKVLHGMGTQAHAALLQKHHIPHNSAFAGIYDFDPAANLDNLMQKWLAVLPANSLVMCHPALNNHANDDAIAYARFNEYHYLSGTGFAECLQQQQVTLTRLSN